MEVDFGMRALYRRVAGIDVHRMQHVVTVLLEQPDGSMQRQTRQYGGFRCDCRALASWLPELQVERVVMESTGIHWKSVYAHLENVGVTGQRAPGQARARPQDRRGRQRVAGHPCAVRPALGPSSRPRTCESCA